MQSRPFDNPRRVQCIAADVPSVHASYITVWGWGLQQAVGEAHSLQDVHFILEVTYIQLPPGRRTPWLAAWAGLALRSLTSPVSHCLANASPGGLSCCKN
jgi:hypothetical protein